MTALVGRRIINIMFAFTLAFILGVRVVHCE